MDQFQKLDLLLQNLLEELLGILDHKVNFEKFHWNGFMSQEYLLKAPSWLDYFCVWEHEHTWNRWMSFKRTECLLCGGLVIEKVPPLNNQRES